ncbi:MAG: CxxxxCH/CxxCH domain-containing protein, partial [Nitrospirae bacterium]|nr:CxxxxCH/CxxCH domain-containing protein [Nitrospirota bacterium]
MRHCSAVAATLIAIILSVIAPGIGSGANQPPHIPETGVNCDSCHLPATDPVWAVGNDPDPDQNEPYNRICWKCHDDVKAPFKKTHSSTAVNSTKYGQWKWLCTNCHNPHQQTQVNFNQYVPSLPGTITAVNGPAKTFTLSISLPPRAGIGDATNLDDYAGWTIVPNRTYKTLNYKIASNTGNTVMVTTTVNASRVPLNSQFGILPGRMLKDVIYTPPPGGAKNARFFALEGQNSFAHNDGPAGGPDPSPDGICQVCHGIRSQGATITHSRADGTGFGDGHATDTASDCTPCHDHARTGFGPNCSSCHGFPPVDAGTLVTTPMPTGSATPGAHAKHATGGNNYRFSCDTCHFNGMPATPIIGDNRIQIGFNLFGGTYTGTGTTYRGQSLINGFNYDFTNGTAQGATTFQCTNVYCHGATMNTAGDRNGGTNITPLWNTPATGACGTCHGTTATNPPLRGSHRTHVMNDIWSHAPNDVPPFNNYIYGRNMACTVCHNTESSTHVDGSANWSFDVGTYPWISGAQYKGSADGSSSPVPGTYGQCANLYCHSIVQTSTGGPLTGLAGQYKTPTWGNLDEGTCGSCHYADEGHSYWADRGMGAPEISSGSHTRHLQFLTITVGGGANGPGRCAACHNYVGSDNLLGCASVCHNNNQMHVDHKIDVLFPPRYGSTAAYSGTPQPGDGYGNCTNVYCHGTTLAGGANTAPAWGSAVICGDCHYASFPTTVASPPSGRSHMRHTGTAARQQGMECSDCHGANGAGGTGHVDEKIQWSLNTSKAGADAKYRGAVSGAANYRAPSATYGQCATVYCHSTVQPNGGTGAPDQYFTPTWGDSAVATCEACHKAAYGDNHSSYNTIATGSHSKHLTYAFTTTDRSRICAICHLWKANATLADSCTYICHSSTPIKHANNSVDVAFIADFNAGGTASYSGTPQPGDGYGSCSSNYCHSTGASISTGTIPPNTSPVWGSGPVACDSCHGYGPAYANGNPKANSHAKHVDRGIACDKCHWLTTRTGNTITDTSRHVNNAYDIGNSTATITYSFNVSGGSCSGTFGCHGNATWGSTIPAQNYTDCVSCHKAAMGSRRQIVDSNGDGSGTGGDFKKTSHHHYGASGTIANADCQMCHDTSQHPGGSIRLKNADSGQVYVYDPANPSTAEDHCLSCHDTDGANGNMSPFSDGKVLGAAPYRAGIDIKSNWNKTYGHRQKGLTCIGNGDPNTGCHAGGHGSDYVGLMSRNLTLPNPSSSYYKPADEASYDLCFNCHQNYS